MMLSLLQIWQVANDFTTNATKYIGVYVNKIPIVYPEMTKLLLVIL